MSESCRISVTLDGQPHQIEASRYAINGRLALQLWTPDGECDTLTINVPKVPLAADEVIANHDLPRELFSTLEWAEVLQVLNSVRYGYAKSRIYRVLSSELLACLKGG